MNVNAVPSGKNFNENDLYEFAEVQIIYRSRPKYKAKVTSADFAYEMFLKAYPKDRIDYKEFFFVMLLNRQNQILGISKIGEGATAGVIVNNKEIFQLALMANASGIILSHNHPSGNIYPSESDLKKTNEIITFAKLIDVNVLDHIIITSEGYYSFHERGDII
tara:strand:- start:160 stop:648 length:489 start_codon:yes stop_codon:yes gene_type:complete